MGEETHDTTSMPVVFVGEGRPEAPIQALAREAGIIVNPGKTIDTPHPGDMFGAFGLLTAAPQDRSAQIAVPTQPILVTQPSLEEVEKYGTSRTSESKKNRPPLRSSEYAKALVTPGIFLRDEYAKSSNHLEAVDRVVQDIVQVLQDPQKQLFEPSMSGLDSIEGKESSIRNARSGETHIFVALGPSACEQAGMYVCSLLTERNPGSEVAEKILSAYGEVLRHYRTAVIGAYASWERMPELVDSLVSLLDTIPIRKSHAYQGMRFRIYDILTQLDTSTDMTTVILSRMDQHIGDYNHPLAYRCALDEWYRHAQGSSSKWTETQQSRIDHLEQLLSSGPRELFDRFGEYERLAQGIVMEPMDEKGIGKIGLEIECGISPVFDRRVQFEDGRVVAPGWSLGSDPDGNREIRREESSLNFDQSYMMSLVNLQQFLSNYGTHIAGLHMNFDMTDFPRSELLSNVFIGEGDTWVTNKDQEHRNELRAVFPLIAQHSHPNSLDVAATASIARFLGTAMQTRSHIPDTLLLVDKEQAIQVRHVFWAHVTRRVDDPSVRFRALQALKHPMGLQSIDIHGLLDQFIPEEKDAMVRGLLQDPALSMNQTIELLCLDASHDLFAETLSQWSRSDNSNDMNKLLSVSFVVEDGGWHETFRSVVRAHIMENGLWRALIHHKDERIVQRTIEYLTVTDASSEVFISVLSMEKPKLNETAEALEEFRARFTLNPEMSSTLIDSLKSDNIEVKKSAIQFLSDGATLRPAQFQQLATLLYDHDITVQHAVAMKFAVLRVVQHDPSLLFPHIRPLLKSPSQRQHVIAYTAASNIPWDQEMYGFIRQHMDERITKKHIITHLTERKNIPSDIIDRVITIGFEEKSLWHRASIMIASEGIVLSDAQIQRILSHLNDTEEWKQHCAIDMLLRVFDYTPFSHERVDVLLTRAKEEPDKEYQYRLLLTVAQCRSLPDTIQQSLLHTVDGSLEQHESIIKMMITKQRALSQAAIDMYVNTLAVAPAPVKRGILEGLESLLPTQYIPMKHMPTLLALCTSEGRFVASYAIELCRVLLKQREVDRETVLQLLSMLTNRSDAVRSFVTESFFSLSIDRHKEAIVDVFTTSSDEVKPYIVEIFRGTRVFATEILQWCVDGAFNTDRFAKWKSLDYIVQQKSHLDTPQLNKLMSLLSSDERYVQQSVYHVFAYISSLPDDFCIDMIRSIQNADDVKQRKIFLQILEDRGQMTRRVTHVLLESLGLHDAAYDTSMLHILAAQLIYGDDWSILEKYYDEHEPRHKPIAKMFAHRHSQMPDSFARKIALQREQDVRQQASRLYS